MSATPKFWSGATNITCKPSALHMWCNSLMVGKGDLMENINDSGNWSNCEISDRIKWGSI